MALTDNLLAYWNFDETSGDRADATGNGYTLTDHNTVGYDTGKIGNAAKFVYTNLEYFTNASTFFYTSGTINVWVKPITDTGAGYNNIFDTGGLYPAKKGNYISARETSETWLASYGDGNELNAGTVSYNTWKMITYTWSPTREELFENGTSIDFDTTQGTVQEGQSLHIGASTVPDGYFDGLLDEMGFWTRVLTQTEIDQLYNSGSGLTYPFSGGGGAIIIPTPQLLTLGVG